MKGTTIEEDSYEYDGPVALCGGGDQVSVDYAYNARMAAIAEKQQVIADEYFQFWEQEYKKLESAQIAANLDLLPLQTQFQKLQLEAQAELIKPESDLLKAQFSTDLALEKFRGAAAQAGYEFSEGAYKLGAQKTAAASDILPKYQQAVEDINPEDKAAAAGADVSQQFATAKGQATRELQRQGAGEGKIAETVGNLADQEALARAGAITTGRREGEETKRLALGEALDKTDTTAQA